MIAKRASGKIDFVIIIRKLCLIDLLTPAMNCRSSTHTSCINFIGDVRG